MNRADFQRLANDRIADAKALRAAKRWSAAYYLAGYAVEAALKACIAKLMKPEEFPDMAQGTLVERQIQDGQRLIDRLTREGVAVTAACWAQESESGQWFLYLVTPLVGEEGATTPAYRRMGPLILELQKEGCWIEPHEVKVIGPHDPIARDILAQRDGRPARTPTWFRGSRLGELAVEQAYIYPPTANPEHAGASKR